MSDLTAKFAALSTLLNDNAATSDALVDTVEAKLQSIIDDLATIIVNNEVNKSEILKAIAANDPCACGSTPTLIVPPVGTTPVGTLSNTCKRVQAFLHTMQEIFTVLDAASAFSVGLNFSLIVNSFNEVVASIESGSDLPVISYPEAVQLVGDMITYIADNLLVGDTLSALFSSVLLDLRDGMGVGTDASNMQSIYNTIIDGSGLPSYAKPVIKDAAYGALYSYYFDTGTSPNLTGYDGTACGTTSCIDGTSHTSVTTGSSGPLSVMILPAPFTTTDFGGFSTWSENAVCTDDLVGYTIQCTAAVHVYETFGSGTHADILADTPFTLGHTTALVVYSDVNVAFDWELCPPA